MSEVTDYITRAGYDVRQAELVSRVSKVEALVDAYRDNMTLCFDKLSDKIDVTTVNLTGKIDATAIGLSAQLNALKDEMYKGRLAGMKWAVGIVFSFMSGGAALVGILQMFHLFIALGVISLVINAFNQF